MGDGMNGPEIARIALDRLAAPPLRFIVSAAFFQSIGIHALNASVFPHLVASRAEHARYDRSHDVAAAGVESHGVVELERQKIEWRIRQDFFPVKARPHDVAGRPCLQRLDMELLAPRGCTEM